MTKKLTILAVLLLAGCSKDAPPMIHKTMELETYRYEVGTYFVREFRLPDGTRCVAMTDSGLQCDWESARGVER